MASEWFFSQNGQRFGPIPTPELKRLASTGKLRPTDMVWKQGIPQWVQASAIPGLFTKLPPSAPSQPSAPGPAVAPTQPLQGAAEQLKSFGKWFGAKVQPPPPTQEVLFATAADGRLVAINDLIPLEHRQQLMTNEKVYHFAYIDFQSGGCSACGGSTGASKQWILVSSHRVLYQASVTQQEGMQSDYQQTSGSIPISKISFVGTVVSEKSDGCNSRKVYLLRINSGGGQIGIAIPSEGEARRLQGMIDQLISNQ